jgi:hypothetical protein
MPIKNPDRIDVVKFMRANNIPNHTGVTQDNRHLYLCKSIEILASDGRLKPFHITGKKPHIFITQSLTDRYVGEGITPKGFVSYDKFSESKRKVIYNTMKNEGFKPDVFKRRGDFRFDELYHHQLPRSHFEGKYTGFNEQLKRKDYQITSIDLARHLYAVYYLERSILKEGFKKNKPVLLRLFWDDSGKWRLDLQGGNHRLQAMRNLMFRGKISKKTKIPVLIVSAYTLIW